MEWKEVIPFIYATIVGVLGAYITVKVAVAELRKDIFHLQDKLSAEVKQKKEMEVSYKENMAEVRSDVKAIFSTLTRIQVNVATSQGRDEVLAVIRESMETISNKNG